MLVRLPLDCAAKNQTKTKVDEQRTYVLDAHCIKCMQDEQAGSQAAGRPASRAVLIL